MNEYQITKLQSKYQTVINETHAWLAKTRTNKYDRVTAESKIDTLKAVIKDLEKLK